MQETACHAKLGRASTGSLGMGEALKAVRPPVPRVLAITNKPRTVLRAAQASMHGHDGERFRLVALSHTSEVGSREHYTALQERQRKETEK